MRLNQPNLCQNARRTDFQRMADKNATQWQIMAPGLANLAIAATSFFLF